jgi:toxoflavin synthase
MFRVICSNLTSEGKFVGITTNVNDENMTEDKIDFYGLDVEVLEKSFMDPMTGKNLGEQ